MYFLINNFMNYTSSTAKFLFFLSILTICSSCCKDNDEYIPAINAFAYYITADKPDTKIPDVGAKVYYYYKICTNAFDGYVHQEEGTFFKDGSPDIIPDEIHEIGEQARVTFIPRYMDGNATIMIESNYYPGKISSTCFSNPRSGAGFYTEFKPD